VASYSLSGNNAPTFNWCAPQVYNPTGGAGLGNAVTLDTLGHVITAGTIYSGAVDFGGITATTLSGTYSGFVTQYTN
jgi:hypothetical protein